MIELISIHIPKTGGTSFYHILQQAYGEALSISYKRRDYQKSMNEYPTFEASINPRVRVLHGHIYYHEVSSICQKYQPKVICWLRNPVDRVISNYNFFIEGLKNPERNPQAYKLNKHRINESLLEYAQKKENQNRMTDFLEGVQLEELFFVGLLENFNEDLQRLAKSLGWGKITIPRLNQGRKKPASKKQSERTLQAIQQFNQKDWTLYQQARELLGIDFE